MFENKLSWISFDTENPAAAHLSIALAPPPPALLVTHFQSLAEKLKISIHAASHLEVEPIRL